MTTETKEIVLKALQQRLGDASDNLNRAKRAFGGRDMDSVWGGNGETRREIQDEYQKWYDETEAAIREVEAM